MKHSKQFIFVVAIALTSGCGDDEHRTQQATNPDMGMVGITPLDLGAPEPVRLKISPQLVEIQSGDTLQLGVEAQDEDGGRVATTGVRWTVADESIATVTENGVLIAGSVGHTEVTVALGEVTDTIDVTVNGLPVNRVELRASNQRLFIGESTTITSELYDANNMLILDRRPALYFSDNPEVVSVNTNGVVTAKSKGSAAVQVFVEDVTSTLSFSVTDEKPLSVEIVPAIDALTVGDEISLTANITYAYPPPPQPGYVRWFVSDQQVVELTGLDGGSAIYPTTIKAVAPGTTQVHAYVTDEVFTSISVTVAD